MTRPGALGLGLHGGPESRVRTVPLKHPPSPTPAPAPPPKAKAAAPPRVAASAADKKQAKKKVVFTLKVKSKTLKQLLTKRGIIKK